MNLFNQIRDLIIKDIEAHAEWREEVNCGKMFGFLVYEDEEGKDRFLKAYSGQILGRSDWEGYVPAIFDYLQPDGYFKTHEAEITLLNQRIKEAEALLPKGKRTKEIEAMKLERKERSQTLQRWLFSQFVITPPTTQNGNKVEGESILRVFTDYAQRTGSKQTVPPGGTGECCAPKLLNYANSKGLKPKAIAEFWYGDSPKGIIRHHGQFYEPCQAKCMPILWYMIPEGCKVYPFMRNTPKGEIKTLWEDDWFVAIDKPAGLLSVPGKRQLPNAQTIIGGSLKAVHRLDMDTSGILLFAKTEEAFIRMQGLFATHEEVCKEYIAIVQKSPFKVNLDGVISLPLSPDFINRPMQKVDYEEGKEAITKYEFIGENRVRLFPLTGRTHQLRVHCAHKDGLGRPILGDPLYGNTPAERMFLHATRLSFTHPFTGERIEINSPAQF